MWDILDAAIMTATDLRSWVSSSKKILITVLKYSMHLENFRQDFVHSWIHCLLTIISPSFSRYLLSHSYEPVYLAFFGCRQYGGSKEKGSALIFWTYSPYSRWSGPCASLPPTWAQHGCDVQWHRHARVPPQGLTTAPRHEWLNVLAFPPFNWTLLGHYPLARSIWTESRDAIWCCVPNS